MLRLVIAAVVLGLIHLLLHRRLVRAPGLSGRWAVSVDGLLLAGWMLALIGTLVGAEIPTHRWRPLAFVGLTWLAAVFYLLLGLAVLGFVLLILRASARLWGRPDDHTRRRFVQVATGGLVTAALVTTVYGHTTDRFILLLAHQPNQIEEAAAAGVDLQVSGHTHGGQMWPLRTVVEWVHDTEVTGIDTVGDTTLFTTYGAGAWGPPVRVAAPPEIAILDLVPDPPTP